jgi:hypothetical protein
MKTVQRMIMLLIALGTLTLGVLIAPAQAQSQEVLLSWADDGQKGLQNGQEVGTKDLSLAPTTITNLKGSGIDVTVTFTGNVCGNDDPGATPRIVPSSSVTTQ